MNRSIKITNQTNYNECGLCVLKSLIKYYHNKDVEMSELIDRANLNNNGLSIYDLEVIADKYGVNLESYEASVEDLLKIDESKNFILVLKNIEDDSYHYVIAKNKAKNTLKIYCSKKGEYELSYKDLELVWTRIYIETSKSIVTNDLNLSFKQKLSLFNWKYLLIVNIINILLVLLVLFGNTIMQQIINRVLNSSLNNLLNISITFFLAFLLQHLLGWFTTLFTKKYNFNLYQILHNKTIYKLSSKYSNFFEKIDYAYLVGVDNSLFEISSFYTIKFNELISDIISILSTIIILSIINHFLLLIGLAISILSIGIETIKFIWQKNHINIFKENENLYLNNWISFLNEIKLNKFKKYKELKINNVKKQFITIKKQSYDQLKFYTAISFIDNMLFILSFIFTIFVSVNLINMKIIEMSTMIFSISILQVQNKSIRKICSIVGDINNLNLHKEIIKNIWNVGNLNNCCHLPNVISNVGWINYKDLVIENDTIFCGSSGSGKTTILKKISSMIETENEIKINGTDLNLIGSDWVNENIIYLDNESFFNINDLHQLSITCYWEKVLYILNQMNIKSLNLNKLSKGQKQALSFISLLLCNNKIILIDELLSNVDSELKNLLLVEIKPEITRNNFVIFVDHNLNHHELFENEVVINEQVY